MKICSACGIAKSLTEFYKDKSHAGGYASRCKQCTNEYWHTDHGRKIKREATKRYLKTPKGKHTRQKVDAKRYEKQRIKHLGRRAIMLDIRAGVIPPAHELTCVHCGAQATEYHHHLGYAEEHWHDVIPLCQDCHRTAHNQI